MSFIATAQHVRFATALKDAALAHVKALRADGVTSMGYANFRQTLRVPAGGPVGTNAQHVFASILGAVIRSSRTLRVFIKGEIL